MEKDLVIVIVGIAFFLITGLFAVLGLYHGLKSRKKQAIIFLVLALFVLAFLLFRYFI